MLRKSAPRMALKRQRARAAGLCVCCCKERPENGRSTCRLCNASTHERMIRYRSRQRERAELQHVLVAHERAGDIAREHHLYDEAAQRYQRALNVNAMTAEERLRISEKFATTSFLGGNPSVENPWIQQLIPEQFHNVTERRRAFELLYQQVRQMGSALRLDDELAISAQALRIAKTIDDPYFLKMANAKMAVILRRLSRVDEAQQYLNAIGTLHGDDDFHLRVTYHCEKGNIAATFGRAPEAYEHFQRATRLVEGDNDLYQVTAVWESYGRYAISLGDTDLAKTCIERALLFARQNQIVWRIPYLCLSYADFLVKMGKHEVAYSYLLDALTYDAQAPVLDGLLAEIGIPLALRMNDETTVARCARSAVIQAVFQSRAPMNIGPLAAAFAQLYTAQGKKRKAQELLHRALEVVPHVEFGWDLPFEIARCGLFADVPQARRLLEKRIALPAHDVAAAYLSLFDAFVAQRHKHVELSQRHALEAAKKFDALRWYGYSEIARTLLPAAAVEVQPVTSGNGKAFAGIQPALTPREEQVAELVLKGLTNREIATQLSITKHTVDSHVASIMDRLGIRSRHQLAGALPSHP